jgi:hypothetical protein
MNLAKLPRPSASVVVASLVVLIIVFLLLATLSLSFSSMSISEVNPSGPPISPSELRWLHRGTPRQQIERQFGKGRSALAYPETGIAVEPMNATCTYYPQSLSNVRNVVQLCYSDDKLISKRAYAAPRGAPLQEG